MKKNPGLLRPFLNTFNYFIGVFISYNFGSYLLVISSFRVLNTPGVFKTRPVSFSTGLQVAYNEGGKYYQFLAGGKKQGVQITPGLN